MFNQNKWHILQLFAGEGAGSAGASGGEGSAAGTANPGENSVDAGHQRLRELGVPESKIRKPRAKQASPLPEGAFRTQSQVQQPTAPAQESQKQAAAAEEPKAQTENAPTRMSWEEIVKDPVGETPLPIPNRTVKTQTAYDTWLETARESEWLPDLFLKIN